MANAMINARTTVSMSTATPTRRHASPVVMVCGASGLWGVIVWSVNGVQVGDQHGPQGARRAFGVGELVKRHSVTDGAAVVAGTYPAGATLRPARMSPLVGSQPHPTPKHSDRNSTVHARTMTTTYGHKVGERQTKVA